MLKETLEKEKNTTRKKALENNRVSSSARDARGQVRENLIRAHLLLRLLELRGFLFEKKSISFGVLFLLSAGVHSKTPIVF